MSRRGISIPLRVCGSGGRGIPPGSVGESWWFCVRPVPSELVRGRLSRFGLLLGGWVFCVWGGEGCRGLVRCLVVGVLRVGRGRAVAV